MVAPKQAIMRKVQWRSTHEKHLRHAGRRNRWYNPEPLQCPDPDNEALEGDIPSREYGFDSPK